MHTTTLEREIVFEFPDEASFRAASNDDLTAVGGRVAELTTRRPTLILDTSDDLLSRDRRSLSLVLFSGFETREHKLVLKWPHTSHGVRNEAIARLHSVRWDSSAALPLLQLFDIGQVHSTQLMGRLELRAVIEQRRQKRTVIVNGRQVFLSYDEVRYMSPDALHELGRRFYLDIETDGSHLADLASNSDLQEVSAHAAEPYNATMSRGAKGSMARDLVSGIEPVAHPAPGASLAEVVARLSTRYRSESDIGRVHPVSSSTSTHASIDLSNWALRPTQSQHASLLNETVPKLVEQALTEAGAPRRLGNLNVALSSTNLRERDVAYTAHFAALRDQADAARLMLLPALALPAVLPLRRSFSDRDASSHMVEATLNVLQTTAPALRDHHAGRASLQSAGMYTMRDVQYDQSTERQAPIRYRRGVQLAEESASRLYPGSTLPRVFVSSDRISATINSGRSTNAVTAYGVRGQDPRISLNYTEDANSVLALAHEIGHALHCLGKADFGTVPSLLKEVVARVHEVSCMTLMAEEQNDTVFVQLEGWRAQFFRPAYQSVFELELRSDLSEGRAIPDPEQLSARYAGLLAEFWGDTVGIDALSGFEWVKAQHLFRPFSLLEYSVSFILGQIIYARVSEEPSVWAPALERCTTVEQLGEKLDLDLLDPWQYERVCQDFQSLALAGQQLESSSSELTPRLSV
jgi:hypothetical protein